MLRRVVNVVQALAVVAAAVFVVLLFANEPSGNGSGTVTDGAALFAQRCASCHGPEGEGRFGPRLHGQATVEVVTNGRGNMPAFGQVLSDDQIAAVVAYANEAFG